MRPLFVILFCVAGSISFAQSCEQKLEDAKRAWFNAQFREVETFLSGCLNAELSKDERFDAYKLMVDAKLLLNEEAEADIYMEKLLALDPNYEPKEVDLAEFKQLHASYDIRTKFNYGISLGVLFPDYVILFPHSYSGQAVQPTDYEEIPGYSIGLTGGMEIFKSLYGDASLLFSKRSFKTQEEILGYRRVSSFEKEYYLDIPLQLKYVFNLKPIKPYIGGGYALHYMIHAEAEIDHWPLDTGLEAFLGFPYSTSGYNLTSHRTTFSNNWIVSAGLQYGFSDFLVELNVSYERGLSNQTNGQNRYSNQELLRTYAYVSDDYKVNTWIVSINFLRNIARPVKK